MKRGYRKGYCHLLRPDPDRVLIWFCSESTPNFSFGDIKNWNKMKVIL